MELNNITWRKASRSSTNGGNCVELARTPHQIAARDSKAPSGGMLRFSPNTFRAFLASVKQGEYDR